jgi:hypothetical protein
VAVAEVPTPLEAEVEFQAEEAIADADISTTTQE